MPGVQDGKQARVDHQGFGISHQVWHYGSPQGLEEAPELPHAAVERGRSQLADTGEKVREEPLSVAQEGALALHAPQLLEQREGDDLRVREPLYGLVAVAFGVEEAVGVVHLAEQHDERLFRSREPSGKVFSGHLLLPRTGLQMTLFLSQPTTQHSSSTLRRGEAYCLERFSKWMGH